MPKKLIDQLAGKMYEEVQETLHARVNRGEFTRRDGADFRQALEKEQGTVGHSKAQKLWDLAWEYGHANGLLEVRFYYMELKELID